MPDIFVGGVQIVACLHRTHSLFPHQVSKSSYADTIPNEYI